jgi:hypothetical protein
MPSSNSDFTVACYRELLGLAKKRWAFISYAEFELEGNVVLWRHDVDISVHRALKLARIEYEQGVSSTYFLMLHSTFYNVLELGIIEKIREIIALGHNIGLHFDPSFYGNRINSLAELNNCLHQEKEILQHLSGGSVQAFSWHNPTVGEWLSMDEDRYSGMINAYGRTLRNRYAYISDSNGIWRHLRLQDVLESGDAAKLQVLTHPEWWQDIPMFPRERVFRAVEGRAMAVMRQNDALLAEFGRCNLGSLDDEFGFLREHVGQKAEALDYQWMRGESASVYIELWRIFEVKLIKLCRVWFRKVLHASSLEVNAVIESSALYFPMHRVVAAIYAQTWEDISGVNEEIFHEWRLVRDHIVHGLRSYPRAKLEEGIVFLVMMARQLLEFCRSHSLVFQDSRPYVGRVNVSRQVNNHACFDWLVNNRGPIGVSKKALETFIDSYPTGTR